MHYIRMVFFVYCLVLHLGSIALKIKNKQSFHEQYRQNAKQDHQEEFFSYLTVLTVIDGVLCGMDVIHLYWSLFIKKYISIYNY